jgi:nitrite reductase/ring-hydroxylating ferredoxin subunit
MSWRPVENLDPATARFPAVAKLGEERVVILRTPKGYRAVEPRCPHLQAALTTAVQMSNGTMLRCIRHNFIFRLSDGKGVNCVGLQLKVYEVRETDGRLEVAL